MPIDDYLGKLEVTKVKDEKINDKPDLKQPLINELSEYFGIYKLKVKQLSNEVDGSIRLIALGLEINLKEFYYALTSSFFLPEHRDLFMDRAVDHQMSKYHPFPFRSKHSQKFYDIEIISKGDIFDCATYESFRFNITNGDTKILLSFHPYL
ncbi:hypothetical protein J4471_06055 [Candidatus Woesearchaeota archaeon]|nr:hypothetical protein [Candidatus Woesearchaeota archaeon]